MKLRLLDTRLGLRNSTTRIPFRYGKACLTRCPQAVLEVTAEVDGRLRSGHSGDCLPPGWFDKSPHRGYESQIDDMLAVIALAEETFREELSAPRPLFPAWLAANERVHRRCAEWGFSPLLASFGTSLVERASLDALCRAAGVSFATAIRENLPQIAAGEVHAELRDLEPRQWLPAKPRRSVFVRHTVGLADPLTSSDVPAGERLDDGLPQTLEQYVAQTGVRYFKIKVSNQLDHDLERLRCIAALVEGQRGGDYRVTLDGNEQYATAAEFDGLVEAIRREDQLATFWRNVIVIEQPLGRDVALEPQQAAQIRRLSDTVPLIIDESDGTLQCYAAAIQCGYRGVSSKSCKGAMKSILNAGLTWWHNQQGQRNDFLMTGEDLCTVGVVSVQSDLCLVATLGLEHVERNGHHYHRGLAYLDPQQQQAALAAHRDFYQDLGHCVAPRLIDGSFQIGSLQCVGFGFAVPPLMNAMQTAGEWSYASLGL